ncbi:subtilisin-like protease SBT5.4 [Malania oleifera]|uniref:subtilisin-like protease SBT5.4 n=1 Tax=Malania oleifera TaxID=397392 RepID=UPI0025AE532C|nr:subtilisin-like protease SBT5.4 [Malania oleifera]
MEKGQKVVGNMVWCFVVEHTKKAMVAALVWLPMTSWGSSGRCQNRMDHSSSDAMPLYGAAAVTLGFVREPFTGKKKMNRGGASTKSYIVYMGGYSHRHELSLISVNQATKSHYSLLGSILGSDERAKEAIFYSYTHHINGFAAMLKEEEARKIAKHPKVVSVFPNRARKLHTTRSWRFMRLETDNWMIPSYSAWEIARYGEDTIIGNIDTGVWPESKSFSDEGIGEIPRRWKGFCENENDTTFHCNRKLIGARYFNKGLLAAIMEKGLNASTIGDLYSPRDKEGHGTHTLSTAGGSYVANASIFGIGNGTAKGGSPKARVAAYRVCWYDFDCYDADILAAFDASIHDGVDVMSVSLALESSELMNDSFAIGSLHAVSEGIVVVSSAGNYGPDNGTVLNIAPWMITVGASTIDRNISSSVVLSNNIVFQGKSVTDKFLPKKFFPLTSAAKANAANASAKDSGLCKNGTLDPLKVNGTILVCLRGENGRLDKGIQAAFAGAVGMILANDKQSGKKIVADAYFIPATNVNYIDGVDIFAYINSTKSPMAYISRPTTQLGIKPAPIMAIFSSRGPNPFMPEILKPDITAPGVDIIAAYTEELGPTGVESDTRRVQFITMTGTSMSCPHVSAIAGLLKTLHPNWSPAAIKSAIMTTAKTWDNSMEPMLDMADDSKATPFAYGAGHVDANKAMDPGLVYDLTINDYLNLLCATGKSEALTASLLEGRPYACPNSFNLLNFNYPSITIPELRGTISVSRAITNVGSPATYIAHLQKPGGIFINVVPKLLKFNQIGEKKIFNLTLKVLNAEVAKEYSFGRLMWCDGKHTVSSPITVKTI